MPRPKKEPLTIDDIQSVIESLKNRIEKLVAIQAGMQAAKQKRLSVEHKTAANKALDSLLLFCDAGLKELREITKREDREWDKWGL